MFNRIIEILSLPIMLLNIGGGIIGGIWLAVLGEWSLIGIGVLLLFTSHWILSILMMPSLAIAGIAMHFYGRKNYFWGHLFGFISQLYTNILIVGTCVFAFFLCSSFYTGDIGFGYIPYLLWSWGMALGPWQFFASKEPDNEFSAITLLSASVFYFLFLLSIFISSLFGLIIIIIFGIVQLLVLPIFNMYVANQMEKEKGRHVI
jgi:hypothetical protein